MNRESIRIYLRHGLMPQPARRAANSADYGEEHVQAIAAIRKLQKERRLPLHLIRRALDGDAAVMLADATAFPHLDRLIAARAGHDDPLIPLAHVSERNPKAMDDALALEKIGAIRIVRSGRSIGLSRIDAQLVAIWGDMRASGYTEELGFGPDICKLHVEAATRLARAELKLFLEHRQVRSLEGPAAEMAHAAINLLLGFFGLVRVRTVLEALRARAQEANASPTARALRKPRAT